MSDEELVRCPKCKETKQIHLIEPGGWCTPCILEVTTKVYGLVGVIIDYRLSQLDFAPVLEEAKQQVALYPEGSPQKGRTALVVYVAVHADLTEFRPLKNVISDSEALRASKPVGTDTLQLPASEVREQRERLKRLKKDDTE